MSSMLVLKLLVGWLTDRCAGSAAVAPTLHFFRKPALGVFWSSAGEMAVTDRPLLCQASLPNLSSGSCSSPSSPPSPDGKAGDGAQYLTGPWPLSCFLTHGSGLSCFSFISICSPTSSAMYKNYFNAVMCGLRDMKLACSPTAWLYFYYPFFLSDIIYWWWKIRDWNLYKVVSSLHGANIRPPYTSSVASSQSPRAVLLQIAACQFISSVYLPFLLPKLTNSRTI